MGLIYLFLTVSIIDAYRLQKSVYPHHAYQKGVTVIIPFSGVVGHVLQFVERTTHRTKHVCVLLIDRSKKQKNEEPPLLHVRRKGVDHILSSVLYNIYKNPVRLFMRNLTVISKIVHSPTHQIAIGNSRGGPTR